MLIVSLRGGRHLFLAFAPSRFVRSSRSLVDIHYTCTNFIWSMKSISLLLFSSVYACEWPIERVPSSVKNPEEKAKAAFWIMQWCFVTRRKRATNFPFVDRQCNFSGLFLCGFFQEPRWLLSLTWDLYQLSNNKVWLMFFRNVCSEKISDNRKMSNSKSYIIYIILFI